MALDSFGMKAADLSRIEQMQDSGDTGSFAAKKKRKKKLRNSTDVSSQEPFLFMIRRGKHSPNCFGGSAAQAEGCLRLLSSSAAFSILTLAAETDT